MFVILFFIHFCTSKYFIRKKVKKPKNATWMACFRAFPSWTCHVSECLPWGSQYRPWRGGPWAVPAPQCSQPLHHSQTTGEHVAHVEKGQPTIARWLCKSLLAFSYLHTWGPTMACWLGFGDKQKWVSILALPLDSSTTVGPACQRICTLASPHTEWGLQQHPPYKVALKN